MIDRTTSDSTTNATSEHSDYPTAHPDEKLAGGMSYIDMKGLWLGEVDDGFEEFVRELRHGGPTKEPPSW